MHMHCTLHYLYIKYSLLHEIPCLQVQVLQGLETKEVVQVQVSVEQVRLVPASAPGQTGKQTLKF